MKLRRSLGALIAAILATSLIGCAADAPTPRPRSAPSSEQSAASITPRPGTDATTVRTPPGEIWEWALGKNVWEDPLYTLSQEQHFREGNTDIYANTMGFSLTPNEQGAVVIVTLFNEETGMNAYPGRLPAGLDWSITGGMLFDAWGPELLSGGYGSPYEFQAVTEDGYELTVTTSAMEDEDLQTARITSIIVRAAD